MGNADENGKVKMSIGAGETAADTAKAKRLIMLLRF
jgi:hypothetical protein